MKEGNIIQWESSIAAEHNRMFALPMNERHRSFVERHPLRAFQAVNTQDIEISYMKEGIIIQWESSIAAEQNRMFALPMSERRRSFVERHPLRIRIGDAERPSPRFEEYINTHE